MSQLALTQAPALTDELAARIGGLQDWVAQRAPETDGEPGENERTAASDFLAQAAALGLFTADAPGTGVLTSAQILHQLGGECMSSAFSFWAHRMVLEYLSHAAPDAPTLQQLRRELQHGTKIGSTAFAAALQAAAGLGELTVRGEYDGDTLVVSGVLPWASNLTEATEIAIPVLITETAQRIVVLMSACSPGVYVSGINNLMALSNTASGTVKLTRVPVNADRVLNTDLGSFLPRTKPVLLTLQAAFSLGLSDRCLSEAEELLAARGGVMNTEVAQARDNYQQLWQQTQAAAAAVGALGGGELLRLRLGAAQLAVHSAQLEHILRGGVGYMRSNATNRRLREALFLPVQSPSEVQLRQELQALES